IRRDDRPADDLTPLELREAGVITLPDTHAARGDVLDLLELRPEERGRHLAQEVGAADVDPAVLVDLTTEEPRAVGALLLQDLGAFDPAVAVYEQRAAFPALDVLRLVEGE